MQGPLVRRPHRLALAFLAVVLAVWLGTMAAVGRAGPLALDGAAAGLSLPMCAHGGPGVPPTTSGGVP